MDVKARRSGVKRPDGARRGAGFFPLRSRPPRSLSAERVGELLGRWQSRELRIARVFSECRGLSTEQLEDLYQETALALLARRYVSEEHLGNALRRGLKHRALNLHRDERRRGEILSQSAPSVYRMAQAREDDEGPEQAALRHEDRLIVSEFLCELTSAEQRVFGLLAEGMGYRAVAPALGIAVNEARRTSRSCERKRERFQLLYDTGRLCGFRAGTIHALLSGKATSEELAERAFAHLESCSHCRAEHQTNAQRLRRSFEDGITVLLPLQALIGRLDSTMQGHLPPSGLTVGQGGVRERAVALLLGAGAGAKVAAGVVSVAVIAGGTIGATHVFEHPRAHPRHHLSHGATARGATRLAGTGEGQAAPPALTVRRAFTPRQEVERSSRGVVRGASARRT